MILYNIYDIYDIIQYMMISWTTGASEASPQARAEGPSVHASYNHDLLLFLRT